MDVIGTAPRQQRPIKSCCPSWAEPRKMKLLMRPDLSIASVGSAQAIIATEDNPASSSFHLESM
jgi:hypothetical protein